MGWRFRGLYTVATAPARRRLTRDEVVAGTWAHIAPRDAPDALLPRAGLLVMHGLGPPPCRAPWDAFWPRTWLCPSPRLPIDAWHRPPPQLVAWMQEFAAETGVPIALYQCEMSGGLDLETAVVADPSSVTVALREDRGTRQWRDGRWGRARHDPLQTMLHALWAWPSGWVFPPHERPLPDPLRPAAAVLRRTSLFVAAQLGDATSVRNLLARGADPLGYHGGLLEAAASGGDPDAVGRLAALGVPDRGALAHAANPDCAAELPGDAAALPGAVQRGLAGTARYLLARGATADPLELFLSAAKGGLAWLVSDGLAAGLDVDARAGYPGLWCFPDGWSAIEWAADAGHTAIVHLLLAAGATLTPAAVVAAARQGRILALRALLDHGADPLPLSGDTTALHAAAYAGHRDIVAMLLDAGADPGAPARAGVALHEACHGGRLDVVELLLDAAPGLVDAVAPSGLTPLWAAVGRGGQPVVDLLLARGADPAAGGGQSFALASYATSRGIRLT